MLVYVGICVAVHNVMFRKVWNKISSLFWEEYIIHIVFHCRSGVLLNKRETLLQASL